MKKYGRYLKWLPTAVTSVFVIIVCIIYPYVMEKTSAVRYIQAVVAIPITLIMPVLGLILKREFPVSINVMIAIQANLALAFGETFELLATTVWWDKFLHTFFGFEAAVLAYMLLLMTGGEKLHPAAFFICVISIPLACGVVWEFFEYVSDMLVEGGDAQRIQASIAAGKSPVSDTMEDLAVTLLGAVIFCLSLLIDKLCKFRWSASVYRAVNEKTE